MMKLLLPTLGGLAATTIIVGGYMVYQSWQNLNLLESAAVPEEVAKLRSSEKQRPKDPFASGSGHASAKASGEGHGGGGGGGESGASSGGGEHGGGGAEAGGGEHGNGDGKLSEVGEQIFSSKGAVPIVSLPETFININSPRDIHYLRLIVEVELFDENGRNFVLKNKSGLQNELIEVAREQDLAQMDTLGGKLFFKEQLVARFNQYLNYPTIRRVYFSDFHIQ